MTGNQILELRKRLGITQSQFGDIILLAHPGVCRWEAHGEKEIPTDTFKQLLVEYLEKLVDISEDPGALGVQLVDYAGHYGGAYTVYWILRQHFGMTTPPIGHRNTPPPCDQCLYYDCTTKDTLSESAVCTLDLPLGDFHCEQFKKWDE